MSGAKKLRIEINGAVQGVGFRPFVYRLAQETGLPGWVLNVLLWVHRIEAVLAIAHVTIIHFFIGHLRRHNFPMDLVMFEGSVDLEKVRHERPAWVARLEQEGKLQGNLIDSTPEASRAIYYVFGFTIMLGFIYLLVNGLVNVGGLLR